MAGQCADGRGLGGAEPVVISPDGRFVYTYSYDSGAIATIGRDPATGVLTQADNTAACLAYNTLGGVCTDSPFPGSGADTGHSLVLSPDGAFLFAAGHGVSAFTRDVNTGALTPVAGTSGCVSADGTNADGTANACTTFAHLGAPTSLAISSDGHFLYAGGTDATVGLAILTVGASGGLGVLPAPDSCFAGSATSGCIQSRYAGDGFDIALSPDGTTLYAMGSGDSVIVGYARNAGTGRLTPLAGTGGCVYQGGPGPIVGEPCTEGHGLSGVNSLTVSPDRTLVMVGTYPGTYGGGVAVLHRDPGTGALSQSSGEGACVNVDGSDNCGTSRVTDSTYQATFTPDGRALLVGAYGNGEADRSGFSVFDVATDGTLTQRAGTAGCFTVTGHDNTGAAGSCTTVRGIRGAVGTALSPDARFLYVGAYSDGGVGTFYFEAAPACNDTSASTAFATAVAIPVSCTDSNGDTVALAAVDGPTHGTVALSGLTATYTPAPGFSGSDSFRVKGNDGANDSAPATVSVQVGAQVTKPPVKKTPTKLSLGAKPKRDRTLPYKFTFSGKLTPAAGTTCSGKVVVTVKHGKKTVAKKTATLSSSCKWKAVVTFKNRKKLGKKKTGKLTAKAKFGGNAGLNAKSSKALTVRYG